MTPIYVATAIAQKTLLIACLLFIEGKSSIVHNKAIEKTVSNTDRAFANFTQAFSFVLSDARNKFVNVRHGKPSDQTGNYQPTITITDNSAVPSNSFHRNHEWAFRFTLESAKADADRLYLQINFMIVTALKNNNIQYNKTELPFGHGDTPIVSYQYRDKKAPMGYRIEFARFTQKEILEQEIIIYFSDYTATL